jgi:hypothetical protein
MRWYVAFLIGVLLGVLVNTAMKPNPHSLYARAEAVHNAEVPRAQTAVRTYKRAAEAGSTEAYLPLAQIYHFGLEQGPEPVRPDPREAVDAYVQAALLGDVLRRFCECYLRRIADMYEKDPLPISPTNLDQSTVPYDPEKHSHLLHEEFDEAAMGQSTVAVEDVYEYLGQRMKGVDPREMVAYARCMFPEHFIGQYSDLALAMYVCSVVSQMNLVCIAANHDWVKFDSGKGGDCAYIIACLANGGAVVAEMSLEEMWEGLGISRVTSLWRPKVTR